MNDICAPHQSIRNHALPFLVAAAVVMSCTSCEQDSLQPLSPAQNYALSACDTFTRVEEPTLAPQERERVLDQAIKDARKAKDGDLRFNGLLDSLSRLDHFYKTIDYKSPQSDGQRQGYADSGGAVADECRAAGQAP